MCLLDFLKLEDEVKVVNLSKDTIKEGLGGFKRVKQIFNIFFEIFKAKNNADLIYLTISESFAGNLKDLLIYIICFKKLNRFYIHLHGGSIKHLLWEKYRFLHKLNIFFLKRVKGVIVSGKSHLQIFNDFIPISKLKIIPNFASDALFITESQLKIKYENLNPIRILYISGLVQKKGYFELLNAFVDLPPDIQNNFTLDIAGKFESESAEIQFYKFIKNKKRIIYHGLVDEKTKKDLFFSAHVFCLPTSFLEGQPISILEAYASGCFVITTPQSGILDIFESNINGFSIYESTVDCIRDTLIEINSRISEIENIGKVNRLKAISNYKLEIYITSIKSFLKS